MNSTDLIAALNPVDLTYEASALIAWESGIVGDMDSVAQLMCKGGPWPPQASIKRPHRIQLPQDDPRPEKRYWEMVKEELTVFLCTNDKKYKKLWSRIGALENKETSAIVFVISCYLGEKFGFQASLVSGFVAVFLFGFLKIGKEAYCRYSTARNG